MKYIIIFSSLILMSASCKKDATGTTPTTGNTNTGSSSTTVPDVYKKIYGAISITSDGTNLTIKTNGMPDHKSAYYPTGNALYEAFSGATFKGATFSKNPNSILSQSYTFKIPVSPKEAASKQATPLGPIGVSVNGVPFFNQYAGPNQPLTGEIMSFDQSWGHPAPGGVYHYHVDPIYLTRTKLSKSALLGFLLDGFPVYGPEENNAPVVVSGLDAYHGHKHPTEDFPNGIYHYHITDTDPYINGNGFFGAPGTISR